MIIKKPTILIYGYGPDKKILRDICAGIEEEGVLYEYREMPMAQLDTLAFLAAEESMLGSGIGIVGNKAAMQMRSLPKGKHVFQVEAPGQMQSRALGANSARAVKRRGFKEV